MQITISLTKPGRYNVEFLGADFQPITNPYIAAVQVQSIENPVGIHKVSFTVPNGNYTIPNIRLTNLTTIYRQILVTNTVVDCEAPVPTPVFVPSPAPVPMPTPIITPSAPTPVFVPPAPAPVTPVPSACVCTLYLMTPTGLGPGATWTVNYVDCSGVPQQTSGNGLDSPRERYACLGSISIVGQVAVTIVGGGGQPVPSAPAPTPIAVPSPVAPSPAPVAPVQAGKVESSYLSLSSNNFLYTDTSPATPAGYTSYYYIDEFPLLDNANQALPFTNVNLSNLAGEMVLLRRVMLKTSAFPSYTDFLSNGSIANIPDNANNIKSDIGNSQAIVIIPSSNQPSTGAAVKCRFPSWLEATIHPNFDKAPAQNSNGKLIAFTPLLENLTWEQTKVKGVTHAYKRAGQPKGGIFETMICSDYALGPDLSQLEFNQKGRAAAAQLGCDDIVTDQFTEGGGSIPTHLYWNRATAFYKGLADASNCGTLNKFFGSYVDEFNTISGTSKFNIAVGGYVSTPLAPYFPNALDSEANARKGWDRFAQQARTEDFGFFRNQGFYPPMSDFMGLMTLVYNGFDEPDETQLMFSKFYEIQQKYAAGVRQTFMYHWTGSQSLNLATDVQWRNSGWKLMRDDVSGGSYWEAKNWHSTPVHNTLFLAFIGLLLTEGIGNWESMRESYSKDVTKMHDNADLTSNGRLNWVSPASSPAPPFNTDSREYPHGPTCVQDLYLVALEWYNVFKSRMDMGFELQYLDYTIGDTTVNVDTSRTGDKRMFTKTAKPFGQHNILHLANNRHGLCGGGSVGKHYAVFYFDPFGDPRISRDLIINFGGELGSVNVGKVRGRAMSVFYSPANPYNIYFVGNGTGSSFSPGSPDGISPNKRNFFTKMAQNGANYLKHVISAGEYSPGPGIYDNEKVTESIRWLRNLPGNPKVDILMVPTLKIGDPRTDEEDLQVDAGGHYPDCTLNFSEVSSNYSQRAIGVYNDVYDHFLAHLKAEHESDVRVGSLAAGNSEEHGLGYASNYTGGPGCGNNGFGGIGDYSVVALNAKRNADILRFGNGNVPYPINGQIYQTNNSVFAYIQPDDQNNRFVDLSRMDIIETVRFWSQGVYNVWERFIDKWRQYFPNEQTHPSEIFYADFFNDQGIKWTFAAGTMHKCLLKANILYHTHNLSPSDWVRNLVGTDVIKGGTYGPNKLSDIEFDSTDLGGPNGEPINKIHLKRAIVKFINHGGNGIHFVLDWTDQQLDDIGQVMQEIYDEYINNPNWVPEWVTKRPNADVVTLQTHNMFNDANYIMTAWKSTGNSEADPFNAKIMNIRVQDTFWTTPNPNGS